MRNQGFTTTELVVTVGILALLTCIAVPTAIAYMPSYNAKRAARDIVSQMQLARIHAINRRVTTVAVFSPASFHPNGGLGHYMIYEDNDIGIKEQAIFALSQMNDNGGIAYLIDIAKTHPSIKLRKKAIFWLGQSNDPKALDTIIDLAKQ